MDVEFIVVWLGTLQSSFFTLFFAFTISIILLSFSIIVVRSRSWCNCHICYTYVTSGWSGEFDNLCDWFAHLIRQSPTRTIHIHVLGNIITGNQSNVEHMLKTKFENYPKGKPFSFILGDLLGRGIFNVDGEHWLFQRKLASLELGSVSVRSYAFGIVRDEIKERLLPLLTSVSDAGSVVELQDVFRRFSFDNICKISFRVDPGCLKLCLPISVFAAAFDTATMVSAARATAVSPMVWKIKRLLNLGSERKLRNSLHLVNVLAEEVIWHRRRQMLSSSSSSFEAQDLLSRFIGSVGDDRYLRDIVVSFLLAGRDTVASTLTSFFYLLSKYPKVETAMLEEIHRVMDGVANKEEVVSWDQLKEMHYVHAALYENMRLYPAVQLDSKFAAEDDVLPDGTYVRKGTRVSFHPYAMGRLPEAWGEDWMEFRPERWLTNGVFTPENPFKYIVFQAGQRMCIGKDLAIMEMKTVIVSVVTRFNVNVLRSDQPLKFITGLTASLQDGLPATVRRRSLEAHVRCSN